jgi:hypothetical protein
VLSGRPSAASSALREDDPLTSTLEKDCRAVSFRLTGALAPPLLLAAAGRRDAEAVVRALSRRASRV